MANDGQRPNQLGGCCFLSGFSADCFLLLVLPRRALSSRAQITQAQKPPLVLSEEGLSPLSPPSLQPLPDVLSLRLVV